MKRELDNHIDYRSPGSSCWSAFLKMGALLENSPNFVDLH